MYTDEWTFLTIVKVKDLYKYMYDCDRKYKKILITSSDSKEMQSLKISQHRKI